MVETNGDGSGVDPMNVDYPDPTRWWGTSMSQWSPRDTWPDLRVTLHLLPWTWRLLPHIYADDVHGPLILSSFAWLFVKVEWFANKPMFREPRR